MQHQQYAQARLSQPAYFILGCLSHGPRDAVALCEAIEQAESLYIEPGTLCRVLAQLEQRGRIAGDDGGERLRRYHITALGMLALQQAEAKYQRNQEQQEQNERSSGLLGGKEIIMRLVMWMLRLYPPAWRERYEAEMAALLFFRYRH
jgi:DNA-binding PadR family transcriptional regulator